MEFHSAISAQFLNIWRWSDLKLQAIWKSKFLWSSSKPCIIHTPRRNVEVTEKTLKILQNVGFPEGLVVIDHAISETVKSILNAGYYAGLTVQVGKLSAEEVYAIVSEYGFERFVLNSDTEFDRADMFATAKTVRFLEEEGVDRGDIRRSP